jgi:hypothetical protein
VGDAADAQLAQASVVEVLERMGEPTTFRMRYEIDISAHDLPLLRDGRLDPGSVIQVLSVADGKADCLVKGSACCTAAPDPMSTSSAPTHR